LTHDFYELIFALILWFCLFISFDFVTQADRKIMLFNMDKGSVSPILGKNYKQNLKFFRKRLYQKKLHSYPQT